jgi:hypothetical protein
MKQTTKHLARQVQQALLALTPEMVRENIDGWLRGFDEGVLEANDFLLDLRISLGYQMHSKGTGKTYAELADLDDAEPETVEIAWVVPDAQSLRQAIAAMPPDQIYHGLVSLAGDVFCQKPYATHWGEPPGERSGGYGFMRSLIRYLDLKRACEHLSDEEFERTHEDQLEAIRASEEEADRFDDLPWFGANQRAVHFRADLTPPSSQHSRELREALQRYNCSLSDTVSADTIEGTLFYLPGRRNDLRTLSHVRRLLNHWQKNGRITWSEQKSKPLRRPTQKKRSGDAAIRPESSDGSEAIKEKNHR